MEACIYPASEILLERAVSPCAFMDEEIAERQPLHSFEVSRSAADKI